MRLHFVVGVMMATALFHGVAAQSRQPAGKASPPSPVAAGQFVWHDLVTHDPEACRAFYSALLGWTFEEAEGIDPGYTIIKEQGIPIGGIVPLTRTADPVVAQWLSYVVVHDVDEAVEVFRRTGGRVFREPVNARKDLRVAVVADPQGAPLGLASRGQHLDSQTPPALHRWLWMEYVAARDTDAALRFYAEAIGFRHEISDARENFTYFLLTTDRPQAGMFRSPWTRDTSAWLPYVRVADPAAMAARATELGGSVALPPAPGVRRGSLAIVLDPTGAPLALQKFPFESGGAP
jgi:predicted enzyme related to lactoylglutathione lyase